MATQLVEKFPVRGTVRWLMRFPIWLYRAHLGWMLGNRFLMLTHVGRKSGLLRQVVVEVVCHDAHTNTYVVASGWGEKSDWFRNIQKAPDVNVHVRTRQFEARAIRLPEDEATQALCDYAQRHPFAFRELGKLMMGQRLSDSEEDCRRLAQSVPLIVLQPKVSVSGSPV